MFFATRLAGVLLATSVTLSSALAASPLDGNIDVGLAALRPEPIRAHMQFLADDALEGRGTAARGSDIAATYIAAQFLALGLRPGGDARSYFQTVPLRKGFVDHKASELVLIRDGKEERLAGLRDYYVDIDFGREDSSVEAPIVYVGAGITAPELKYDDYEGIDVRGKIVAVTQHMIPQFPPAVYASYFEQVPANAAAHGAVGILVLYDPGFERIYPYELQVRRAQLPQFCWTDESGHPNDYQPELRGRAFLDEAATERLFARSGHGLREIRAALDRARPHSFPLRISARIRTLSHFENTSSPNVVAVLEGSDPVLKNQYLVYTSHFDHDGIGEPVNGDAIYNGALDNASGVAVLLETARAYATLPVHPKRSIAFVAVTAEEVGHLGSDYFVRRLPTDIKPIANLNLDTVAMQWPLHDVLALGTEHSTLRASANEAAAALDLSVSEDPFPEQVLFVRSDHYSFVKQGIPATFLLEGFASRDPTVHPLDRFMDYMTQRYHHPNDDMNQSFDWTSGVDFARFYMLFGYVVAQAPQPPSWNPGDFFAGFKKK